LALTQIIVLAILHGLAQFLPISASGHTVLLPLLTDWPDQGLAMDVAVRTGTWLAVCVYFWRDLWSMLLGLARLLRGKRDPGARLALQIIIATIPVLGAAWAFETYVGSDLQQMAVIGWATLGYALLMLLIDKTCMTIKRVEHASYVDVLLISCVQVLAFVPGTSRVGITITMARLLGYERPEAARLSMLLSIPTIAAATVWLVMDISKSGTMALSQDALLGLGTAFVAGLAAIAFMMAWLRRAAFTPFVIYRAMIGLIVLAVAYGYLEI